LIACAAFDAAAAGSGDSSFGTLAVAAWATASGVPLPARQSLIAWRTPAVASASAPDATLAALAPTTAAVPATGAATAAVSTAAEPRFCAVCATSPTIDLTAGALFRSTEFRPFRAVASFSPAACAMEPSSGSACATSSL
jgi:hypothetical protein